MGKIKTVTVCDNLSNPPVFIIKFGAGAASRYGSGSTKMMRLHAALAPQHCLKQGNFKLFPKSWGFYSFRSDPVKMDRICQHSNISSKKSMVFLVITSAMPL
jgi:hypothetical protein